MRVKPSSSGGRIITGDGDFGQFALEFTRAADSKPLRIIDADGNQVGTASIQFREPVPADFDVDQERRRAQAGGCCGNPSEATE